ncbi:general secretion pathway protein E [Thermosipho africanus Ob7]|nr:GspE/PulE family protein [Thermosipho africanus]RDI92175.1 general secretion pathway protein E [Thermosipho africanus Ob7]
MMEKKYKRLGDILIEKGIITEDDLEYALKVQKETRKPIGEVLVELGFCTWQQIVKALAEQYEVGFFPEKPTIDPSLNLNLKKELIEELRVIPIKEENGKVIVVTDNVYNLSLIKRRLKFLLSKDIEVFLVSPSIFDELLMDMNAEKKVDFDVSEELYSEEVNEEEEVRVEELESEETPIVRLVNNILNHAIELEASDIHIEPMKGKNVIVRYRIDGVLKKVTEYPKSSHGSVVARIKIMSNLDITEKRIPQDGKFYLIMNNEQYDFRVSTMPSVNGEKVVLRILRVSQSNKKLEELGYSDYNFKRISELIKHPYGIILVTGPTGSGKSTTLVGIINSLNHEGVNIVTAEDPVEYTIEGVTQCQVNPEIGLTFARYLRAFLRQDPDIIMVGEIRDKETANLAIEASLTGHLVLSTLHTNTASGAVDRLLNMGIDPSLISSALIGVIGQRLVRKVCTKCAQKEKLDPEFESIARKLFPELEPYAYRAVGCDACNGTGYKGRTAINEVLIVNDELRYLINNRASIIEINKTAKNNGMRTLFEDGLYKVLNGETTIEEILRVTGGSNEE